VALKAFAQIWSRAAIVVFGVLAGPCTIAAQSYPARPVRIVVMTAPGGAVDTVSRILANAMSSEFGRPVIVENRPGASGTMAAQLVASANPDGHTLLVGVAANLAVAPHLLQGVRYDPVKAFAPIGLIQRGPYALCAHSSVPARNLREFLDYARHNPGKLNFATPGVGSAHHLVWELLISRTGIQLLHVPFQGGATMVTETVAGRTQLLLNTAGSTMTQYVQAGRLRYLGLTGASRLKQLPDVPTFAEQGMPGFEAYSWWGLLAPAGTPSAVIAKLNSRLNAALELPEIRKQLIAEGVPDERFASTPAEFGAWIAQEHARWGRVIKDANIRIE
jgi:tripartite-type tricarboxylate transporter receptor subunit TctC